MRALAILGVALAVRASSLEAQRSRQYEIGAFGAFTRYDRAFNLDDKVGGGVRLGYFIGSVVGVEADVLFQPRHTIAGTSSGFEPLIGSGSLILNLGIGERHSLYVLGGYSRLDFGRTNPYQFTDGGMHGAAGARLSFGERVALRLEARAVYSPETNASFGTEAATHLIGTAGLSLFHSAGPPPTPAPAPAPPAPQPAPPPAQDSDTDGVVDEQDACPGTPSGATVDERGCHSDADSDGVYDGLDQCPNTPIGAAVDPRGCPADTDGDTVPDGIDRCPNTPLGATVDGFGCPLDTDRDGVLDGLDRCPDTPAGTPVDTTGCPLSVVKDSDHDGVEDSLDRCPGTPPNSRVDALGCVILFREERGAARTPLVLQGVTFETGRSALRPESYTVLDVVAASLVANPEIRIEIAGHTDSTGSAALNLRLSQARAQAVRAYLARKGVSPTRMLARGYGLSSPVVTNATAAGRAQNRRVELRQLP